jgi:hypothetical protein
MVAEARTMDYLRAQHYPVPAVEEVSDDGTELVMERIDGPSMVGCLGRRPWTVRHQATVLADLHRRLHDIPPPEFLRGSPIGDGDHFLHLDLHPLNVIVGPRGPVVIDWPNAARGDPAIDVGLAWILMAAGEVPTGGLTGRVLGGARALLVNGFMAHFDTGVVSSRLREIVAWKVQDANISPSEQQTMWQLVEKLERSRPGEREGKTP